MTTKAAQYDEIPSNAALAFGTFVVLGVAFILAFFWFIRSPERLLQQMPYTPDGVKVLVVDFPGGANVVSFDPALVTMKQLQGFATKVCGYAIFDIKTSPRRGLFQVFSKDLRAEFIC
ncbi:hypothetical protein [Yoonia sp.]|uniref:hypothetical protein n=1 Tax=Yoonia sp. TaxID=2212373 RepID=UPI00238A6845|nr:hypothetical protein [Yoonia sp.]MDE0851825.1 hypothetical protein [Yoonia sp.]